MQWERHINAVEARYRRSAIAMNAVGSPRERRRSAERTQCDRLERHGDAVEAQTRRSAVSNLRAPWDRRRSAERTQCSLHERRGVAVHTPSTFNFFPLRSHGALTAFSRRSHGVVGDLTALLLRPHCAATASLLRSNSTAMPRRLFCACSK